MRGFSASAVAVPALLLGLDPRPLALQRGSSLSREFDDSPHRDVVVVLPVIVGIARSQEHGFGSDLAFLGGDPFAGPSEDIVHQSIPVTQHSQPIPLLVCLPGKRLDGLDRPLQLVNEPGVQPGGKDLMQAAVVPEVLLRVVSRGTFCDRC
jgi:hypothetical protein